MAAHWSSENGAGGIQQFFETCQIRRDFGSSVSVQNAQNVKGKCKICGSIVSFSRKATSNLVTHVKRKHPEHYEDYARNKPQYVSLAASCSANNNNNNNVTSSPSVATDWASLLATRVTAANTTTAVSGSPISGVTPAPSRHAHANDTKPRPSSHSDAPIDYSSLDLVGASTPSGALSAVKRIGQTTNDVQPQQQRPQHPQLNSSLVRLVCGNLLPLHFVDSDEFKEFVNIIKPVRYTMPTQKDLSDVLLPQKKLEMEANLGRALRAVDSVCLTLDIWSHSRRWSFLGITAHFVSPDWTLGSAMLTCKRFGGRRYTMEYIVQQYEQAVWAYGLQDKVVSLVTHNIAADADGATSASGHTLPEMYLVRAFGSNGNSLSTDGSGLRNETASDEDGADSDESGSGCCGVVGSSGDRLSELECVDFTSELFLPGQEDCFSHSLHLAVKEGLQDCQQLANLLLQISSVLSGVRTAIGCEEVAASLRRERRRSGSSTSRWRWNAQLNVVRYVLKVIDDVKVKVEGSSGGGGNGEVRQRVLDGGLDRHLLAEVLEILEPIEEASSFAESQDGVSISYVVPCVRGLVHHLENYRACHLAAVVEQLRASVLDRLLAYNERRNYLCGAMLDPRFKSRWARADELDGLKAVLLDEAEKLLASSTENERQQQPARHEMTLQDLLASPSPPEKMARLSSTGSASIVRSVRQEVDEYLSEPCLDHDRNPLHYWRDGGAGHFPALARLARHLLPICASSAKVEQIFDADGSAFRSSQCWLSSKTFETMMAVKCNRVFWK